MIQYFCVKINTKQCIHKSYSLKVDKKHLFLPQKSFGYQNWDSPKEFEEEISRLFREEVFPCVEEGICATVYTQLTDDEAETNSLLSYDRKVQ